MLLIFLYISAQLIFIFVRKLRSTKDYHLEIVSVKKEDKKNHVIYYPVVELNNELIALKDLESRKSFFYKPKEKLRVYIGENKTFLSYELYLPFLLQLFIFINALGIYFMYSFILHNYLPMFRLK